MKRIVKKQIVNCIETKSQQALKKMQEQNKIEKKKQSREEKNIIAQLKFELQQKKKYDKHRGR